MRGIGYKEIVEHLEGNTDYEETVSILKRNTRRFAKRQYTWFPKDKDIKWFGMDNLNTIDKTLDSIVKYISTRIDNFDSQE